MSQVDWTAVLNRTARNYLAGEAQASARQRELLRLMRPQSPIRYNSGRQTQMAPRPRPLFHMEDWQKITLPGTGNQAIRCPMTGCEWLYSEARRLYDLDARNIEGAFQGHDREWYTFSRGLYPTVQPGRLDEAPEHAEEPENAIGTIRRRFVRRRDAASSLE